MTTPIKNVAIAGATGFLGRQLLNLLLRSNLFNTTVLTRSSSTHGFPSNVTIKVVNYDSIPNLQSALEGQDAIVSALAHGAISTQINLFEAAFNAGVKRVIPSEYGNDTLNPKLAEFPIYQPKITIRKHLEQKVAENPGASFSWTSIFNVSFLAPGYPLDFLVDVKSKKADIRDGGDVRFNATTIEHIGQAITSIFTSALEETANRPVKISSVTTTQNEIIEIAKEIDPAGEWELTYSKTVEQEKLAFEEWEKGNKGEEVVELFIWRAFIGTKAGYFAETDNALLGIEEIGKEVLRGIVKEAMKG